MRVKRYTGAGILMALCLVLASCASDNAAGLSPLVKAKLAETRALEHQARQRNVHGAYVSKQVRPETERDSGRKETLLFVNNVYMRTFGNIGYTAERAVVSARAKDESQPVLIDDPQSFDLILLSGRVVVSPASLTELLAAHVFNFDGSPLRKIRLETKPDLLVMSGEMNRRGKWVPFSMEGTLAVAGDGAALAFTPRNTVIAGQSANALLEAANADLDELITLRAPGVTLTKSVVYMKPGAMFPPPALTLKIKSAKVEERGLVLEAAASSSPAFPEPLVPSNSYIVMRGGDVKFLNMMPVNILMQIMATAPDSPLDFCLYDYRRQLTAGSLKFQPGGGVLVYLKNYNEMAAGEATR